MHHSLLMDMDLMVPVLPLLFAFGLVSMFGWALAVVFVVALVAIMDMVFMDGVIIWGVGSQGWATNRPWCWWRKSDRWHVRSTCRRLNSLKKKKKQKNAWKTESFQKNTSERCFSVSSCFWALFCLVFDVVFWLKNKMKNKLKNTTVSYPNILCVW